MQTQLSPQPYLCYHCLDFPLRLVEAVVERNRVEAIAKVRQVRQELHSARGSSLARKNDMKRSATAIIKKRVPASVDVVHLLHATNDTRRRLLQKMTTSKITAISFAGKNKKPEHSFRFGSFGSPADVDQIIIEISRYIPLPHRISSTCSLTYRDLLSNDMRLLRFQRLLSPPVSPLWPPRRRP